MAKYKLKSLSVLIGGKVFKKSDKEIFDTNGKYKGLKTEIEAACKKGFFVEIVEEKSEEVKKEETIKPDKEVKKEEPIKPVEQPIKRTRKAYNKKKGKK